MCECILAQKSLPFTRMLACLLQQHLFLPESPMLLQHHHHPSLCVAVQASRRGRVSSYARVFSILSLPLCNSWQCQPVLLSWFKAASSSSSLLLWLHALLLALLFIISKCPWARFTLQKLLQFALCAISIHPSTLFLFVRPCYWEIIWNSFLQ